MDLITDFNTCRERIINSLVATTKTASQLSGQDLSFHRAANESFSDGIDRQTARLLRTTNKLLKTVVKDTAQKVPNLQDVDNIDENWSKVTEVIDNLLEKADISLDEFTGVLKRAHTVDNDTSQPPTKKLRQSQGIDQWAHSSMSKPQLLFHRKVDNNDTSTWKPLLKTKPHALVPLEESIGSGEGGYHHPYAYEIEILQYPQSLYQPNAPIKYSPPDQNQAVFVDTEEGVQQMLEELKQANEIAIDLEHNDKNSYVGLVCLMQISTRNKDWIIDTLKPWRENLQVLNEVFADPRIVKVLHGSSSDIIWLQRDLGLYVVGLFDTFYAANALLFPAKSLKYLLQRFAGFEAQKQFQLSDWRVRPLPKYLVDYARSDTHYLLYIFDCLKIMLKDASTPTANLLDTVLDSSKRESLQTYERHNYDGENGLGPAGWLRLLMSRSTGYSNEQFGVFRALHAWRDHKARELDEGDQNIMPNNFLFTYAEQMPTRRPAFFQRGLTARLPQAVIENVPEICEVVKNGKEQGKTGPSVFEAISKNGDKVHHLFGRHKFPRKKLEDVNRGVGATLQRLNGNNELSITPSIVTDDDRLDITVASRSTTSQLFGDINLAYQQMNPRPDVTIQALRTLLPFSHAPSVMLNEQQSAFLQKSSIPAQPNPVTNGSSQLPEPTDGVFVISDRSKKRKAESAPDGDESATPDSTIVLEDTLRPQSSNVVSATLNVDPVEKARRDAQQTKKNEKRAKQAAQAAELKATQTNVVPFDYANAESILHAKPDPVVNGTNGQMMSQPKPLNPFAKALDTSTGARRSRMGKELAGKSHTFTS